MTQLELQLQKSCIKWFRQIKLEQRCVYWATPNGMFSSPKEWSKMRAMGARPGVADLQFIWDSVLSGNESLKVGFIELKVGKNKLTDAQTKFKAETIGVGCLFVECRSLTEVGKILFDWGLATHAQLDGVLFK